MSSNWLSPAPWSAWFRLGTPVDEWWVLNGAQLALDFAYRIREVYIAGDPAVFGVPQAVALPSFSTRNMQYMANALRYWYGPSSPLTTTALAMATTTRPFTIPQMQVLLWFVYGSSRGAARQYIITDTPVIYQESSARPGELPIWYLEPAGILVPPDSVLPGLGTPPGAPSEVRVGLPPTEVAAHDPAPIVVPTATRVAVPSDPNAGQTGKWPLYAAIGLLGASALGLGLLWVNRGRLAPPPPPPRGRRSSARA